MRPIGRVSWPFAGYVGAVFAAFGLYVRYQVRPELLHEQEPAVFRLTGRFLAGFLDHAGGPLEAATAFLAVLLGNGWIGTLVLTGLAAVVCLALRRYLAVASGTGGDVLFLGPAVLMLVLLGRYVDLVPLTVGLAVTTSAAVVYLAVREARGPVRLGAFVALSAVVYYLVSGLYAVSAVLCGIFEWRNRESRWLAVVGLACAAVALGLNPTPFYEVVWRPALSPGAASVSTEEPPVETPAWMSVAFLGASALVLYGPLAAWARTGQRWVAEARALRPASWAGRVARAAVLLVLAGAAVGWTCDPVRKCQRTIFDHYRHGRWAELLEAARQLPVNDHTVDVAYAVNRGLYHTGRLLEEMFAWPQRGGMPSLTLEGDHYMNVAPLERSDVLFELGQISEAEHLACEALEIKGDQPRTLKRLARLYVLKGQVEAARVFLNVLAESLGHRAWAHRALEALRADPLWSSDPEVSSRRPLMLVRDRAGHPTLEEQLRLLLDHNPRNRMALEYLMAYYLLTRQVDKVAAGAARFRVFGLERLPRHVEEAIVLHWADPDQPGPDLAGYVLDPETRKRHQAFVQSLQRYGPNPMAAWVILHQEFGESYFLYHAFGATAGRLLPRPQP